MKPESLNITQLSQVLSSLKEKAASTEVNIRTIRSIIDDHFFVHCHICESEYDAYKEIPDGWGYLVDDKHPIMMCDKCTSKWIKRFGNIKTTKGEL